jgi:PAS domain S-box-containing protein
MKIDRNSLRFKITFPIFIVSAGLFLFVLLTSNKLLNSVIKEYHSFFVTRQSFEIKKIFERAITELSATQLIRHEFVVSAKKMDVLEEIKLYWSNNNFEGIIKTTDEVIYSSIKDIPKNTLISQIKDKDHFFFDYKNRHLHGFIVHFPAWEWQVITLAEPEISESQRQVRLLIPLIFFGFVAIIGSVFFILHRKLSRPIDSIISNIRNSNEINKTGITEIDMIGSSINDAFGKLNKKTAQCLTLHDIAISLYEQSSIDQTLHLIIDKTSQLINAELAAIALYDDNMKFKRLITRGTTIKTGNVLPEGKGLLEFMRLSLTPIRIDNVLEHPAFSGSFPEGHPIVKNLLAYPLFSSEGKPIGALYFGNKERGFSEEDEILLKALSADVSIAINKAESIRQLQRFQQIIDSAFDIVVITDANGYIVYANPAFEKVTGYLRKDAIGKKPNILKSGYHDEDFYKNLWNTITAGSAWQGEFANRKKSGEIYYESAVIFPIYFEEEFCYVAIKRDITKEKKLYEQLLRAQKMEAIGTLAGGIAHDFNNLLTAILGYSEIMMGITKEGDQFYKPVTIINNAAQKGAELAKKILMVTRKEKMELRPVNINEIINNSLELLHRTIPKNIEIVVNLKDNIPNIMADPSQMQQVVMNLAVNARDAMPDGGRLIIETSIVGAENGAANGILADKGGFMKLSISDTGIGMDKNTQRNIFDPFFTTKEPGKGTGLGLYIVHSVISNHSGYMNLYSEPDKGTRFNIYLPITKGAVPEKSQQDMNIKGTGTILIIDDDADIRELCMDMLGTLGYTVLTAGSGSEGISIFRGMKDNISVVILDMIMPKMGGSEVFQAIKTIRPDVKIILCSGYSSTGFAGIDKLLKSGATGFVQKPFTLQTIAQAIKKTLSE